MDGDRSDLSELFRSIFHRIYVINLPERRDRLAGLSEEFAALGMGLDDPAVHVFPAIRPPDRGNFPSLGARGCFESHLGVLRLIAGGEAEIGLLLEDDAGFVEDVAKRLEGMAAALETRSWDLLYGFYSGRGEPPEDIGNGLVRCAPADEIVTAHFIAVHRDTASRLIPYLEAMKSRPLWDPDGGPMHVDGAYNWFRRDHPRIVAWAARPALSVQRPSPSDIQRRRWFDRIGWLAPSMMMARRVKRRLTGTGRGR